MNQAYQAALDRLEKRADQYVLGQAMEFHADWVGVLSSPGTGRMYGKHQASAPGEAPAVDTGLLRQAVQFAKLGPLSWGVGVISLPYPDGDATTAEVAVWQEFGHNLAARTRISDRKELRAQALAPRPHARAALQMFKARYQ